MSEAEQRESMEFDVLVVGGGPAGLAAAIKLKQLAPEAAVCLVEKGGEIGAHILSGAVIEPRALDELLPDWRDDMPELTTPAPTTASCT
jgi:electron-transferring-flavoprotein dehydrogenase